MKIFRYLLIFLFGFGTGGMEVLGQTPSPQELEKVALEQARAFFPHYLSLVSLPNDAHYPEQLEPNLQWLEKELGKRGFQLERLETDGIPLLLASYTPPSNTVEDPFTVMYYLHIDGQPVDPSEWDQADPYQPVLKRKNPAGKWEAMNMEEAKGEWDKEWRIFGRAAADDKGPIGMFFAAWDGLQALGKKPAFSLKILFDPEEEISSPHLPAAIERHRKVLKTDLLLIMDGPMHASNQPTLTYGARGIASMRLITYGPIRPQHSGHYGNYAPNPAIRLARLLASIKDEAGRVSIEGYYDGITLTDEIRAILQNVPDDELALKQALGLGSIDHVGSTLQEALQFPSFNVRGMGSGWIGKEVRTIIPATATAEIDIRLVKESDPERLFALIRAHIEKQGYTVLDHVPSDAERLAFPKIVTLTGKIAYEAFRTDLDHPYGVWLFQSLNKTFGKQPVQIRTMGGSVPISPMIHALGVPAMVFPLVNSDNNQHSPNENLRLGNYVQGTQALMGLMLHPFHRP